MGIFDEIKVEEGLLPDGLPDWCYKPGLLFQTKSLDPSMDKYTITEEGLLILHSVTYEVVPEEERPYYGSEEWEESEFLRSLGSIRATPTGDIPINYHGDIKFYTGNVVSSQANSVTIKEGTGDRAVFVSLSARFTDGLLESITIEAVSDVSNGRTVNRRTKNKE